MPADTNLRTERIKSITISTARLDPSIFISHNPDDQFSFNSILNNIKSSIWLLKTAAIIDWDMVPESLGSAVENTVSDLSTQISSALIFSAAEHKQDHSYQRIVNGILNGQSALFSLLGPITANTLAINLQTGRYVEQAKEQLALANNARLEIDKILQEQRNHAVQAVVEKQRQFFKEEAGTHKKYANAWLGAAGVSAILALVVALYASFNPPESLHAGSIALTVFAYLPRFIVLSIMLYALSICGRNYRTSRHNFIINQHRNLALSTFRVFTTTTEDAKIRDAILIQAAGAIYSPQASGYGIDQSEPLPHAAAIDILQRLGNK